MFYTEDNLRGSEYADFSPFMGEVEEREDESDLHLQDREFELERLENMSLMQQAERTI